MWEDKYAYGGAYVLGHFESPPLATDVPPHLQEQTIYVGMTTKIRSRPRYHEKVEVYKAAFKVLSVDKLYVALYDVSEWFHLDPPRVAYLLHLERKLIWEYAQRWNRLPALNRY